MAEVASSYPTAGGLYYWSAKLAKTNAPAWSLVHGWFNLLGQVAVTAGIDFGLSFFINAFLNIAFGVPTDPPYTIAIYRGRPVPPRPAEHVRHPARGATQRRVRLVARRRRGDHLRRDVLPDAAITRTSGRSSRASSTGPASTVVVARAADPFYVMLIGLLNAQYTLTGYDASAHMSEETHDAAHVGAPGHRVLGRRLGDLRLHPPGRR